MAKKKVKFSKKDSERIEEYLVQFSRESQELRQELANSLPSYNFLLALNAGFKPSATFEDIRLFTIAREKGLPVEDPFFDFKSVKPPCPSCGGDNVRSAGPGQYICNKCGKKYAANYHSISSRSNVPLLTWMRFIYCLYKSYSIKDILSYCSIAPNTYYNLLRRVAYAMECYLCENLKLYGKIQTDITFFPLSYKGSDLHDSTKEYPEGSLFDDKEDYWARESRHRGGNIKMSERESSYVSVITFVDEFSHVYNKYIQIGPPSAYSLKKAVGDSLFLPAVPSKDPFPFKKKVPDNVSSPDQTSLIITDGERAIQAFAGMIGIECESNVYRRNGKQLRLPSGHNHIQKANNVHSRLKAYLRRGPSSAYLGAYITIFNFFSNIPEDKVEKAIGALLEILARPGLGKPDQYYIDLYTPPSLWKQWSQEDNPLRRFNENQLTAIYQYHLRRLEINKGISQQNARPHVKDIAKETQFTEGHIRRLYKNAVTSNILEHVIRYFESQIQPVCDNEHSEKSKKISVGRTTKVTPELLAIYDTFAIIKRQDYSKRPTVNEFLKEMNEKYGTTLKKSNFRHWCNVISESGLRPPLPEFKKATTEDHMDEYIELLESFENIRAEIVNKTKRTPTNTEVMEILAERTGIKFVTLYLKLRTARKERQKLIDLEAIGDNHL